MKRVTAEGGKELPVYVETVNGADVYLFASRNDEDGGIVTATLVDDGTGKVREHRTWTGPGVQATQEVKDADQAFAAAAFLKIDAAEIALRAEQAVSFDVEKEIQISALSRARFDAEKTG